MAKLAEVEKKHGQMTATGQIVDSNFQSKFNGMSNFSQERRRQRRLEGGSVANVNFASVQDIRATSDGVLLDNVVAQGHYDGSQLKPDSIELGQVQTDLTLRGLDFSGYGNPGNGNSRRLESDNILLQFQRSAADAYLEEQKFDDQVFLMRQPIILPPKIEFTGTAGTESNPVELSCSGSLANAWSLKLNSAEPQVMRRRRTKEVGYLGTFETVVEFPAEATVRQMILNGNIPITVSAGGSSDGEEDLFGDARFLLGTEGVGAFMETNTLENVANIFMDTKQKASHRSNPFDERANPSDYEWEVDVVAAEPLCDKLRWTFFVTASDRTGTTNRIDLHAYILYGETEMNDAPQNIQTRCDTSSIDVEDLEYDYELQDMTGYDSFILSLRTDNCPSPYVHLIQKEDIETNPGTPCTTDYKTVHRIWDLDVFGTDDSHLSCPVPNSNIFPFIQTFTLGGLADENGLPATPQFDLRHTTYYLPNEPDAAVATTVSDIFVDNTPPSSECGLCKNNTIDSVFYNHTDDFVCGDHGKNTISVRVVNNIGIEITKTAAVTVIDDKPPNVVDSFEEVPEDGSIRGNISSDTWDNCYIGSYELIGEPSMGQLEVDLNLPDYKYFPDSNYFGSGGFTWMATDWQDNPSNVATVGFDVIPVNDPPYIYKLDRIVPFTILASDVDDAELHVSAKHTKDGGPERDGLPTGLFLNEGICNSVEKGNSVAPGAFPWDDTAPNAFPRGSECSWVLSNYDKAEKGLYNITLSVTDDGGGTAEAEAHSIETEILVNYPPIYNTSDMIIPYAIFAISLAFTVILTMV